MSVLHFTAADFEASVLRSDTPVLVDFWAPWCGPCRMMTPIVDQLAEEYAGRVAIGKVNVDEEPELARAFWVFSIPAMILFKNGQVVEQKIGASSKGELIAMLEKAL